MPARRTAGRNVTSEGYTRVALHEPEPANGSSLSVRKTRRVFKGSWFSHCWFLILFIQSNRPFIKNKHGKFITSRCHIILNKLADVSKVDWILSSVACEGLNVVESVLMECRDCHARVAVARTSSLALASSNASSAPARTGTTRKLQGKSRMS